MFRSIWFKKDVIAYIKEFAEKYNITLNAAVNSIIEKQIGVENDKKRRN